MNRPRRTIAIIAAATLISGTAVYLVLRATGVLTPPYIIFTRPPYLQNATRQSIILCWATDLPTTAKVRVATQDGAEIGEYRTPSPAQRQETVIGDLHPGRTYRYDVHSAHTVEGLRQGTFTTAPDPGRPFEFAVFGDSRKGRDVCQRIAGHILSSGAPIAVHTGDLVGSGVNLFEWNWMFFEPCRELLRAVVFWPVIGNHELGQTPEGLDGRTIFTQAFALPGNERYYSFDWGDAHFLMLDSNDDCFDDPGQYGFAEQDLAAARATWKFAVWHHPVFNAGKGHGSHIGMRTLYCPLLARYNVDMIFTGHEHNYQRSKPIRHFDSPVQQRPYIHLVTGGAGAPLYEIGDEEIWSLKADKVHHFVLIRVEGSRLTGRAIDLDGKTFDEFEVDKSQPPSDAVAYEFIELDRLYREATAETEPHP